MLFQRHSLATGVLLAPQFALWANMPQYICVYVYKDVRGCWQDYIIYLRLRQVCLRNCRYPDSQRHDPWRHMLFATFMEHCSFTRQSNPSNVAVIIFTTLKGIPSRESLEVLKIIFLRLIEKLICLNVLKYKVTIYNYDSIFFTKSLAEAFRTVPRWHVLHIARALPDFTQRPHTDKISCLTNISKIRPSLCHVLAQQEF